MERQNFWSRNVGMNNDNDDDVEYYLILGRKGIFWANKILDIGATKHALILELSTPDYVLFSFRTGQT